MKYSSFAFIVFFLLTSCLSYAQSSHLKNVAISKPKIKATESYTKGNKYIQYVFQDIITESQGLVNFVDRKGVESINTLRNKGYQDMESNIGSTEMEGVEFIIETKLLNYREIWKSYCDVVNEEYLKKDGSKDVKKISEDCRNSSIQMNFDLQVNLVSVETGEVISKREISPSAFSYGEYIKEPTAEDKTRMRILAYEDMKECFKMIWKNNLLKLIDPEIEVLDMADWGKDKVHKLYISGGMNAIYPTNVKMNVVKKYTEDLAGEKIERSEKIGELIIESKYHQYSVCKVKKGKKDIFQALDSDIELVCTPGEMRRYESCGIQPRRERMMAEIKAKTELIKLETPAEEEEKKSTTPATTAPKATLKAKTPTTTKSGTTTRSKSPRGNGGN